MIGDSALYFTRPTSMGLNEMIRWRCPMERNWTDGGAGDRTLLTAGPYCSLLKPLCRRLIA
jgi:hypothetical protein